MPNFDPEKKYIKATKKTYKNEQKQVSTLIVQCTLRYSVHSSVHVQCTFLSACTVYIPRTCTVYIPQYMYTIRGTQLVFNFNIVIPIPLQPVSNITDLSHPAA